MSPWLWRQWLQLHREWWWLEKDLQFALKYVQSFIQCIDSSARRHIQCTSFLLEDRIIEICSCTAGYIYQFSCTHKRKSIVVLFAQLCCCITANVLQIFFLSPFLYPFFLLLFPSFLSLFTVCTSINASFVYNFSFEQNIQHENDATKKTKEKTRTGSCTERKNGRFVRTIDELVVIFSFSRSYSYVWVLLCRTKQSELALYD